MKKLDLTISLIITLLKLLIEHKTLKLVYNNKKDNNLVNLINVQYIHDYFVMHNQLVIL